MGPTAEMIAYPLGFRENLHNTLLGSWATAVKSLRSASLANVEAQANGYRICSENAVQFIGQIVFFYP